jgi:hypothetical protein
LAELYQEKIIPTVKMAQVFDQQLRYDLAPEYQARVPTRMAPATRQSTFIRANTNIANPGDRITFDIPASEGYLLTNSCFFRAEVISPAPSGGAAFPACGMAGIIKSIKVYHTPTGQVIDDVREYGELQAVLHSLTTPSDVSSNMAQVLSGTASTDVLGGAADNTWAVGAGTDYERLQSGVPGIGSGRTYAIPLKHTILDQSKALPMKLIGGVRVELEFGLALESLAYPLPATGRTFQVRRPELQIDMVTLNPAQQQEVDKAFLASGMRLTYGSWSTAIRAVTAQTATLQFGQRHSCTKTALVALRSNSRRDGDDKDPKRSRYAGVTEYQWQLGEKVFPQRPITKYEAFTEALAAFHGNLSGADVKHWLPFEDTAAARNKTSFVIARDFESSHNMLSGSNVMSARNTDLFLNLECEDAEPNLTALCWLDYQKVVRFSPDGTVDVLQ